MKHLQRDICGPHLRGVSPGTPPWFKPGCPKCEEKKAKGLVTGNEPAPAFGTHGRLSQSTWAAKCARDKARKLARKPVIIPWP